MSIGVGFTGLNFRIWGEKAGLDGGKKISNRVYWIRVGFFFYIICLRFFNLYNLGLAGSG